MNVVKRQVAKSLAGLTLAIVVLAADRPAAAQQAPAATGTVRYTNGAAWATFELFPTSTNAFGFWGRIYQGGNTVITVAPSEKLPDGRIVCWWISYQLIGAADPNRTNQWVETATGRLVLNPATATGTGVDGIMATLATGAQNTQRVPVLNPQWFGVRLTVP